MRADGLRILVIEDDRAHAFALSAALDSRGYSTTVAHTGVEALEILESVQPDVITLDLGLPDFDGLDVCSQLRTWTRSPIIVVSADSDERRIVEALELGADDFVTKPYSMEVLAARVGVAMRHRALLAATVEDDVLTCGDLTVDVAGHIATADGTPVELQYRQFSLLVLLMRNVGKVVPHGDMARVLLEDHGRPTDMDRLRVAVSLLRKQLGTGPQRPRIETEKSVGYRLVAPDG